MYSCVKPHIGAQLQKNSHKSWKITIVYENLMKQDECFSIQQNVLSLSRQPTRERQLKTAVV